MQLLKFPGCGVSDCAPAVCGQQSGGVGLEVSRCWLRAQRYLARLQEHGGHCVLCSLALSLSLSLAFDTQICERQKQGNHLIKPFLKALHARTEPATGGDQPAAQELTILRPNSVIRFASRPDMGGRGQVDLLRPALAQRRHSTPSASFGKLPRY
jgi:hypothetical protein